jgi:hypothetical protein
MILRRRPKPRGGWSAGQLVGNGAFAALPDESPTG